MAQVLPSAVLDPLWRWRATVRLGDGLPSILLGLFAIFAVALLSRHKRTLRVLAVVCGALAMLLMASLLMRALDLWDVRPLLTPQEAFDFGETSFVVFMKYLAALLLLCTLAIIAWQASPRPWSESRRGHSRPRDIFPRSEGESTGDEAGGPEDLDIAEVEPPDPQDEPADPGSAEAEAPFKRIAEEENQPVAKDYRVHIGDLGLVGKERDIEPMASSGIESERRAVKADGDVGRRQGVAGGANPGGKGRRKPGRNPKTGAEIPAPPDDVLRSEVRALVDDGESLTNARRKVAGKYGIGLSTVRDRTK
ncbi:MAG: hypothetical protein OEO79_18110 [Gemmatimonadota bacterium]|nr:hypothetical protein [Gemmatimonadota bacterium]